MTELYNYAEALFLIAEEDGVLEAVKSELLTVKTVLLHNPEYSKILDTPSLPKDTRLGLVTEAFSSLSENTENLIKILTENRQMHGFDRLYSDFLSLYNKKMGIIPVEVISAVALSESQKERLKAKLSGKLSAKVELTNTVDRAILGGLILRYDSVQLDGSLKLRLDSLAESLKSAVV